MNRRRVIIVLIGIFVVPPGLLAMFSIFSRRPDNLGLRDGRLSACPATPNCVCTFATDDEHAMEPIPFSGTAEEVRRRLQEVIREQPRAEIITDEQHYMHVEFTSFAFRFVDDVEFLIDTDASVIHFRSASRIGRSDLGANRRRMERIRNALK